MDEYAHNHTRVKGFIDVSNQNVEGCLACVYYEGADDARTEGFDHGYDVGYQAGYEDGKQNYDY